jgi:hypothetical protein
MSSLPAAFAVSRIPPPAESTTRRRSIFPANTSRRMSVSFLKVVQYLQNVARSVHNRGPGSIILSEIGRPPDEDSQPGYPEWENSVTFSRSLTKR